MPHYLGYVVAMAGAAWARRSATAAALTGLLSVAYCEWIPVEERQPTSASGAASTSYLEGTHRWLGLSTRP